MWPLPPASHSFLASLLVLLVSGARAEPQEDEGGNEDASSNKWSNLFEEPQLREDVPPNAASEWRDFNITGHLGIPETLVTLNRTWLAYGTGAVLASTFLGAALVANLGAAAESAEERKEKEETGEEAVTAHRVTTTRRKDDEAACNCEAYCYETYFRDFQVAHDGGRGRKRR